VVLSVTETRTPTLASPRAEYICRLEARRQIEVQQNRLETLLGNGRVAIFFLGVLLVWLVFGRFEVTAWLLIVPIVLFSAATIWHNRVKRATIRAARAASFYERGLARIDDRWIGTGEPGTRFLDEKHPYAPDFDLFGNGSLFELLCTARTHSGEETLANWLRAPAMPDEVQARQAATLELRPRLDLREDLSLLGSSARSAVDLQGLASWGASAPLLVFGWARLAVLLLALVNVAALVAWLASELRISVMMLVFLVGGAFALWLRDRVRRVLATVEKRAHDLSLLAGVLARLEREQFSAPRLVRLRAALDTTGRPPSQRILELVSLLDWLNSYRNPYFAPFGLLLLWNTQFAFAIESWRARSGPAIGSWLAAVGEFEALSALAAYSYENPEDPFPEIAGEGPCFDGEGLGHPLIPKSRCVRNDVRLGGDRRVLVVSGSNMSGKSTLLRTVGINAVLALAGAPVRAQRLRLSPLAVGATLRIQDSLQAGRSRFFAEITRVHQLVELTRGPLPLLFLLDEVFAGTNSHDRRLGAEAVVRGLVEAGAIGLVTTHDLALTHIADRLAPQAANVHFEDRFENETMTFDYLMRPGVVQHSNALALMRAVGLKV
jgi:hypothetical protein